MIELKNKNYIEMFTTPLFIADLPDLSVCDRLETTLKHMRDVDVDYAATRNHSSISSSELYDCAQLSKQKQSWHSWQSRDNLYEIAEFSEITNILTSEVENILDFMRIKRDSVYVNNMWGNISSKMNYHNNHVHPNSYYSAILYVKTPEDCGVTTFHNPATHNLMIQADVTEHFNANAGTHNVTPKKGTLVVFPSWIPHSVTPSFEEIPDERITLATTFMLRTDINLHTRKIKYS